MRVSSTMMIDNYLTQTNNIFEQQTKLMEQSDGSKLHRPSDDAIGYSKYLRFSDSKSENTQYQENVKTGFSWMKNTDSAMVNMTDRLKTVVGKVIEAASDSNTETDMQAIAREILGCVQQVVSAGNTQVNGRYLFAGQADLTQPFVTSTEELDRGCIKSLDEKQIEFFNDPATIEANGGQPSPSSLRSRATMATSITLIPAPAMSTPRILFRRATRMKSLWAALL